MNNSISSTLSISNRVLNTAHYVSKNQISSPSVQNAKRSTLSTPRASDYGSSIEQRMSVVNIEAGLSAKNSQSSHQLNQMSLVYRFGETSRSRISSTLTDASETLRQISRTL